MNQLSDIDMAILDARMDAVCDALIPVLKSDCQSTRGRKHHQRQALRIRMAANNELIDEYEQQINAQKQ